MAGNLGAWFALLYKHCPWADKVVTSFLCPTRNKPNAEKPRFTTEKVYAQGSQTRKRKTRLSSASLKPRGLQCLWNEQGWGGWSLVQFSGSVLPDSLRTRESQHARPPCPSPTPGVYSNSRQLSLWCHPAISSSVVSFSSCRHSLPASGYFPMSQLFAWGGQSIGERWFVQKRGEVICAGALGCSPLHILNGDAQKDLRVEFSSPLPFKGHSWDTTQVSFRISSPN